ncbi:MAG: Fur family transcriptional regulator, stress-responsive regulator [Thermoleophilaceae bacterium]|jgi:Fe2+ or Zn2+ uptake regulation protein|nr:Fur family transcriptional regulator, stress-responsive regulator [Thermoleophilaceae bacterium]
MTQTETQNELTQVLHRRGQRVTPQRLVIHRTLQELNRHVSAEEVLDAVAERLPNVSLPTVYSTLELLGELGLLRRVGPAGGRMMFDPRLDEHQHVVCSRCGRIEDLEAPVDAGPALAEAERAGWSNPAAGLLITGVCERCGARS